MVATGVGGLVAEVLDIFERHGLRHHDDDHTSRAIVLVRQAAHTYGAQLEQPVVTQPRSHGLTDRQLRLLVEMCDNARICVTTGVEICRSCDSGVCPTHACALARAETYSSLVRQLGAQT
jgi:hypothetical protein